MKLAVTELAALNVMVQLALPWQLPDHPEKVLGAEGASLRVTTVFFGKEAEHFAVEPDRQSIPEGLLVTVPVPPPAVVTVRVSPGVKLAATVCGAVKVRWQVEAPEQAPPQPEKE